MIKVSTHVFLKFKLYKFRATGEIRLLILELCVPITITKTRSFFLIILAANSEENRRKFSCAARRRLISRVRFFLCTGGDMRVVLFLSSFLNF